MYLNALNLSPTEYAYYLNTGALPKRSNPFIRPVFPNPSDEYTSSTAQQPTHHSFTFGSLVKTALLGGAAYFGLKHFAPQTFATASAYAGKGLAVASEYAVKLSEKLKTLF